MGDVLPVVTDIVLIAVFSAFLTFLLVFGVKIADRTWKKLDLEEGVNNGKMAPATVFVGFMICLTYGITHVFDLILR